MNERSHPAPEQDRLQELLLDHTLWGLDADESMEFEQLVQSSEDPDAVLNERQFLELAGAAATLAFAPHAERMPSTLRERLENEAFAFLAGRSRNEVSRATRNHSPRAISRPEIEEEYVSEDTSHRERGWIPWVTALASAAIILLAIEGFGGDSPKPIQEPAAVAFASIASVPGSVSMEWEPLTDVKGSVVWNPQEQNGVMKFEGLRPNDPQVSQYQLWIFDESRTHRHPVDGGVFDVGDDGEVYVRFTSRLEVDEAVAFVVTEEEPGGVVVSGRERIACGTGVANIRAD